MSLKAPSIAQTLKGLNDIMLKSSYYVIPHKLLDMILKQNEKWQW